MATFSIPDSMKNPLCDSESGDVSAFTIDVTNVTYPLSVTSIKQDGSAKGSSHSATDIYDLLKWLNDATDERWDASGAAIDKQKVFIHSTKTYTDFTNGQSLTVVVEAL